MIDESHRIIAEGTCREILSDHDLLVRANLTN
jgi:hypothetical protein